MKLYKFHKAKKYMKLLFIFLIIYIFTYQLLKKSIFSNQNFLQHYLLDENEYIHEFHHILEPEIYTDSNQNIIANFDNISVLKNFEDLKKYVYIIDPTAYALEKDFDIQKFLNLNMTVDLDSSSPKILIFHTHSQEAFVDSRQNVIDDTIVGVGKVLANILSKNYNIGVVHDMGQYDFINGKVSRGNSYENMEPAVKKILEKYPTIEVAIDLHRDAIENKRLVTIIDNKPTAKIMFFNGISRENKDGLPNDLPHLYNENLDYNLAFSFRLFLTANQYYTDFARKNYIKPYRYSLHLLPKTTLVEVGADTNTVEEAKNAMIPLADILYKVISD